MIIWNSIMEVVHPGSFQPGCYSHRSATSDLLGAHCTAVQLNGLLLGRSLSRSLFSHTTDVCVVPVSLIYVTRLPRSIMQQAAPLVRSLGGKCATLWPMCVSNLLLCTDHNELTLACLPSPYTFDKNPVRHLHLLCVTWEGSAQCDEHKPGPTLKSVTLTNPAADDDLLFCRRIKACVGAGETC